jgi:2-C-methyl-D-erythritol 4-phosphate cytidylyltransferase
MGGQRKQFRLLGGKPLLVQTVLCFERHAGIDAIAIAAPAGDIDVVRAWCREYDLHKVTAVVPGGRTRQESVRAGLDALDDSVDLILTHDAVRPFVSAGDIESLLKTLSNARAAVLAAPVTDTLCRGREGRVTERVDREGVFRLLTPQGFHAQVLRRAHREAASRDRQYTDEVTLVKAIGVDVTLVTSATPNIKVTTPADWQQAHWMWEAWQAENVNG